MEFATQKRGILLFDNQGGLLSYSAERIERKMCSMVNRRGDNLSNALNHSAWFNRIFAACALLVLLDYPCVARAKSESIVSKWGRFEHSFKSSVAYTNALQEATLTVVFTSAVGITNQVEGFWDGGKTWRVRFAPYQVGKWTFKSACSDSANKGLHDQTGEFVCTAPTGPSRFKQHGPVRVALDNRHFEHADGTPFFWLGDTAWSGARVSQPKEWQIYARTRAVQNFTAVQWAVSPGADAKQRTAYTGKEHIAINPDFFQRLDSKLETLSRSGLLSAIAPLLETSQDPAANALTDDQTELLLRYIVARWGAEPIVWTLAFGDSDLQVARWKKIGRSVFGASGREHTPVLLYAGAEPRLLKEFREESWVDAYGYQSISDTTDAALKAAQVGPFSQEWAEEPPRPLIPFTPRENAIKPATQKRWTAEEVRRAAYWSLLVTVPAGLTYGSQGVVDWDRTVGSEPGQKLPLWQRSLFMPGAKQMGHLGKFMASIDFWRLRPQPGFVTAQPGGESPARFIAAAGSETKDCTLVYVPEDRTLEIYLEALPPSPSVTWLNPRGQENSPAVAVVGGRSCQFPTPEPGDWLLVMKAGK